MYSAARARALLLATIVFSFLSSAEADDATCESGWEWSYNSNGQNPCEIAGWLQASCLGFAGYVLGPLDPGATYNPPAANDNDGKKCGCNTVIYSLYMACTACQNHTFQTWSQWNQNCGSVQATEYPFDIPLGVAVPHWAYLDYTEGGQFDPTLAKAAGRDPEATPKGPSTISLPSSTTPASSPISSTLLNTQYAGEHNGGSKTNVGAIVGGVVGGVAVIVAYGVLAFVFLKRRRRQRDGVNGWDTNREEYRTEVNTQEFKKERLYNPSDPSTYPPVLGENNYLGNNSTTAPHRPGGYTGTAEL